MGFTWSTRPATDKKTGDFFWHQDDVELPKTIQRKQSSSEERDSSEKLLLSTCLLAHLCARYEGHVAAVCVFERERECVCVCVCQRKTKDRADGMREKKCPLPSTGFEPVSLGYAPIVLPIAPRQQARLTSVEWNTSDTHPLARSRNNHAWKTPTPICGTATPSICKDLRWVGRSVSKKDER